MRVHVRFFAALREAVGREDLDLDLPPGSTPEDVWSRLTSSHPQLAPHRKNLAAAVNRRYSPFSASLAEGDEIVFIPPVSGG
jgi:molybdopterin converting factor subunit 1